MNLDTTDYLRLALSSVAFFAAVVSFLSVWSMRRYRHQPVSQVIMAVLFFVALDDWQRSAGYALSVHLNAPPPPINLFWQVYNFGVLLAKAVSTSILAGVMLGAIRLKGTSDE